MLLLDTRSRLKLDIPRHSSKQVKEALDILRNKLRCYACGSIYDVEFAHIHGRKTKLSPIFSGRGKNSRFWDIVNNPNCYIPLCDGCHRMYDNNKLDISDSISLLDIYNFYYNCSDRNTYKQDDNILEQTQGDSFT